MSLTWLGRCPRTPRSIRDRHWLARAGSSRAQTGPQQMAIRVCSVATRRGIPSRRTYWRCHRSLPAGTSNLPPDRRSPQRSRRPLPAWERRENRRPERGGQAILAAGTRHIRRARRHTRQPGTCQAGNRSSHGTSRPGSIRPPRGKVGPGGRHPELRIAGVALSRNYALACILATATATVCSALPFVPATPDDVARDRDGASRRIADLLRRCGPLGGRANRARH
jgi:hypothetical protein